METKKTAKSYSPEVKERAVRMVIEHQGEHASQWTAIGSIAAKIGCSGETLRKWLRQHERDAGLRDGMTSEVRDRLKALERENRELRQANEIPGLRRGRLCAKLLLILPGRTSPAVPSHDRLHRRAPRRPRGRADLPRSADRPVDISRPRRAARRSGQAARTGPVQYHSEDRNPARVRRELPRLWRPQGLAPASPGRDRG